jgi:ATP-dependent DNA helicase RecG
MGAATRGRCYYPLGSAEPVVCSGTTLAPTSKTRLDPSRLDRPVACIQGVGRRSQDKLRALGVTTIGELLLHLPFRHEEPSRFAEICELKAGDEVTLRVQVMSCSVRETSRRRVKVLEALISDHTGSTVATWYNQAYLETAFRNRPELLVRGVMVRHRGGLTFLVKRHEILAENEQSQHILGLVPVYPSTGDLSVRTIRTILHKAAPELRHMIDPMPARVLAERRYARKGEAVWASHFPSTLKEAEGARSRLAFEELLLLQLAVLRYRAAQEKRRKVRPVARPGELSTGFLRALPYSLTGAQTRVMKEIESDLCRGVPMRRLLHGDVGSGKTVVAAYCLLRAVEQGAQAVLMAPTEVLADQHYLGLSGQLSELGVRVGLLKGGYSPGERRATLQALESGKVDVVIGTHALIQAGVRFRDLRLAVVDEQHRFGVRQRDAILAADEQGYWPHTLHMSATPIPRTLSLTLYGDVDISVLDEMPADRRSVVTKLVFGGKEAEMWDFVRQQLSDGYQTYVVCPLIEDSESLQTASARQTFADLSQGELAGFRVRLLHGQLAPSDKASAMAAFASGEVQVLVSTSVIEVGVDVARANVMVIMGARRFGLSQLHQLRGRVGRGQEQSYCFLMADGEEGEVLERLALFARTPDGFELAEADLRARGEGQLFGERQSGLGDLAVASLIRDRDLLEQARKVAAALIAGTETRAFADANRLLLGASELRFGKRLGWLNRV